MANWTFDPNLSLPHLMQGGGAEDGLHEAGENVPGPLTGGANEVIAPAYFPSEEESDFTEWLNTIDPNALGNNFDETTFYGINDDANPMYPYGSPTLLLGNAAEPTPSNAIMSTLSNGHVSQTAHQPMTYPSNGYASQPALQPMTYPSNNLSTPAPAPPISTSHRVATRSRRPQPRVTCSYPNCHRSYARPSDLRRHALSHQVSAPRFDCPVARCPRRGARGFVRLDKCREHVRARHDGA